MVNANTGPGLLLKRTRDEITSQIRSFLVAEDKGSTCACVSLFIYNENLAEIRSLAVVPEMRGRGIGSLLVQALKKEALNLKIKRLFTLTTEVSFFQKNAYNLIDKQQLPEKIWKDCIGCLSFPDCKESALLLHL